MWGKWKDQPVTIKVTEGGTTIWAKAYPVSWKNHDHEVFKEHVYQQCEIGALHELLAEETKERESTSPFFGAPKKNGTI